MGYLGKISAIVSANTSDFSAKLMASGKEVQSWARSLNTAVNSASSKASSSLRGIYTEAQKAERALQAIQTGKIKFAGFEGKDLASAVDRMRSLVSVTKEINGPLNQAARALERMPAAMQGGFLEAMKTAQKQAELIAIDLNQIAAGKSNLTETGLEQKFKAIADRAMRTADAVERLKSVAGGVGALATGKELQFRAPEFAAEMVRAKNIQAQAAATPGGDYSAIIGRQQAAAEATAAAFARMEEAQLTLGGDVKGTTAEYQRQLGILQAIGSELEDAVASTSARANAAQKAADNEIAVLKYRAQAEAEAESKRAAASEKAFQDEVAILKYRAQAEAELDAKRAASEEKALQDEVAVLKYRAQAEAEAESKRAAIAEKALQDEVALLKYREQAATAAEDRRSGPRRAAEDLLGIAPPPISQGPGLPRELAATGARVNALRSQIDALPVGMRNQMIPALRAIQNEFVTVASRGRASAVEIQGIERSVRRAEEQTKRYAQSSALMGAGGAISGSRIKEATGQLEAMQRVLVQVGATASGPVARAYEAFRARAQQAIRENNIGLPQVQRQLNGLAERFAKVASQTGNISFGRAFREIRRGGDIARMGFDRFSLGIQQAGFAVDDFFSSVGGWDQKVRAVSNNITQMAFIMGGTTGLFAGLAFVIGAQIALAINKFVFKSREAEAAAKAMNTAIDAQRDKVKELADAYRTLAVEIAKSGMTKEGREQFSRRQAFEDRRRQGDEAALDAAAARSPRIAAARGLRDFEKKNREDATTVDGVLRAAARERAADSAVRRREAAMLARARSIASEASYDVIRGRQITNRTSLERAEKVDAGEFLPNYARRRRIAEMRERDATLEAAAAIRRQRMGEGLISAGQAADARLAPTSQRLDEIGFTRAGERINKVFRSIATAMDDFESGRMTQESLRTFIDSLSDSAKAAEEAARPIIAFADVLRRLGSDAVRAGIESGRSKEEELRQSANRASGASQYGSEYDRNAASMRSDEARSGERRIADARREATAGLYQIEQEQAAIRSQFEAGIEAGNGPAVAVRISRRIATQNSILNAPASSPELKEAARVEIERLEGRLREIIEAMPESQALRERADGLLAGLTGVIDSVSEAQKRAEELAAFDRELESRANPQGSLMRGLDLSETPAKRAAREMRQGAADIREYFSNRAGESSGMPEDIQEIIKQENEALSRFQEEKMRDAAPTIFDMADEVRNAVIQGPSRQGLTASDASSVEGQRELNRLLRGDDSARDVNLVELEKQTKSLEEIARNTARTFPVAP